MSIELHKTCVIALDAMGGDHSPHSVLSGAEEILKKHSHVFFILFGNEALLSSELAQFPLLKNFCRIVHAATVIAAGEKPSIALRQGKQSSMRMAIDAVREGVAQAAVSAGNTGALMAMAKIVLRTLPDIDRPAICTLIPTLKGRSVMLDLGANIECNEENLYQFAVMGDAFAKTLLKLPQPKVGLLNVGAEDMKGHEIIRSASHLIKQSFLAPQFHGYIEGNDIAEGTVDIIVTDGFSGNIALKTAEGTAKICREFLKQSFNHSLAAKIGFFLAKPSLKKLFQRIDHRFYNGAMFLGLNGIIVKSHGHADSIGFANAIQVAMTLATENINAKITQELHSQPLSSPSSVLSSL